MTTSSDGLDRLEHQLAFLLEVDRLKQVERQTSIVGDLRRENTAEHSWHLALFALVLAEWSDEPVDLTKVLALCLVHDLVEIDAGDTFAYDTSGAATKAAREQAAAERLFALLPPDQGAWFHDLWLEYEAMETPESRFANAVDRLQPVMLNHVAGERSPWVRHQVTHAQVTARNSPISRGSQALWQAAQRRIDEVRSDGWLHEGDTTGN
jgi:putative hydrolase of HD superfamily